MTYDIAIRNARLRNGSIVDIAIAESKYAAIEPQGPGSATTEISVDGRLVTESFVIAQLHLDKVLTGDWLDAGVKSDYLEPTMGGAMTTIERAAAVKLRYAEEEILERIRTVLEQAEACGRYAYSGIH